jgi:hypothetical protein
MVDNRIVAENAILQGRTDRSYWDVQSSNQIEGFATDFSVNAGGTVDLKINVNGGADSDYKVEIFRLGYYGGSGAREVAQWTNEHATVQPQAQYDASRALVDAGNWSVTDSWHVPTDAVSGVYLARLQRLDANGGVIDGAVNQIPFVIRNDGVKADIVVQTSDTTWQAYNGWFGNNGQVGANLYGDASGTVSHDGTPPNGGITDRAFAVSYNRPFITRDGTSPSAGPQDYVFGADYAGITWLEKNGYDVSYMSGIDTDRLGANYLKNYKSYISIGHDEYWSGAQRANVEAARDAGVNLLFWSGNECYWKTRWDTSIVDGTAYRTLVCYKETRADTNAGATAGDYTNLDPSNVWTGTWRDMRFVDNPLAGNDHTPENALTGQLFSSDGSGEFGGALDVPTQFGDLRMWRDTSVANGGKLDIAPGLLGYEWDTSPNDLSRPAGLIKLSETTLPWSQILTDQGNTTAPGVATHTLSIYRAESGALVFGAGSVFWSWALSNQHDNAPYGANIANVDLQQFTMNMFADMGIQPGVSDAVLASENLVRAVQSLDHVAAKTVMDNIPDTVASLSTVVISGTATDNDGNAATVDGHVAVVEVSLNGGGNWQVASTNDNWAHWSYNWTPIAPGNYTIEARAIDDSLNISSITPSQDFVTVPVPIRPPTFNLFDPSVAVTGTMNNDNADLELGMKFTVGTPGTVTDLKYWRAAADASDTDVRPGHLWAPDGTLLATVNFSSAAGATGWQTAHLTTPVALAPGVQYVVSYHTNNNYVATGNFFAAANEVTFDGLDNNAFSGASGVVNAPQSDGVSGNGVYHYGSGTAALPDQSYNATNYWVDVAFQPASSSTNTAPVITSSNAFSIPENQTIAGTVVATDVDHNALTYAISGGADAAKFTINATTGVLSFLTAPNFEAPTDQGGNNIYDLVIGVTDSLALPVLQNISVAVTDVVSEPIGTTSHLYTPTDLPNQIETADTTDYELGVRFTASQSGSITELRYYRGAADANDVDTRTLHLWSSNGTALGSVVVTSAQGATGWQTGTLSSAVAIQANTTYVASYGTVQNYAFSGNYFGTPHPGSDGILTGLAGGNGVFSSGGTGAFPTSTYNNSNYWVDVSFQPAGPVVNTAPVITASASLQAAENQSLAGVITATDAQGDPLTFSIAGGADAVLFAINASTGALTFLQSPNFEAPADSGGNNVYDVIVGVSDGKAPVVTQAEVITVTNLPEGPSASSFVGHLMTAEYVFGSTPNTLYPSVGASQNAIISSAVGTVEFSSLPPAGPAIGNGSFGLAGVDLGPQSVTISFPLDPAVFGQSYVPFAPASSAAFNGVRISDGDGSLQSIRGITIVSQQGFTNASGIATALTSADFTVTSDGIFLNMAGKGRMVDSDPTAAGVQSSAVQIAVNLNDNPVTGADSASVAQNGTLSLTVAALVGNDFDPDGDTLIFNGVGNSQHGTAAYDNQTGQITFTPQAAFTGAGSFDYTVLDGFGGSATGTVSIDILAAGM